MWMMNRRPNVTSEYARDNMADYMRTVGASGTHVHDADGRYTITLRRDAADRGTALHEWLHYARVSRGIELPVVAAEEGWIDAFLTRHRRLFRIEG